ncbi:MAG: 5'-methylthioadenosine/S-adenosylhomocysteine nucleosidase [Mycoplasmataceae bacterium]|jgi:adenosylhomocysteine nucleosidase|nr:5'-methylthioadenosine/S-adenosylhomocysteine nucleosidase [Mycoplasmataceae bacterium]
MIGFVISLKQEVTHIWPQFNQPKIHRVNGFELVVFNVLQQPAVLIYSGVGKANAASASQTLINHFNVSTIVNLGSCGAVNGNIQPISLFLPHTVTYYDVDVVAFGYAKNQIPHCPAYYGINSKLLDLVETTLKGYGLALHTGKLATGEVFINQANVNKYIQPQEQISAVDMEACAIAQICHKNDVKFCTIKIVSDTIHNTTMTNQQQWQDTISKVSEFNTKILVDIANLLVYHKI